MHRHAPKYAVKFFSPSAHPVRPLQLLFPPLARSLSLNSAINRGIRRSQKPSREQDSLKKPSFKNAKDSYRREYDTTEAFPKWRDTERGWKTRGRVTKPWRARDDAPQRSVGNNYGRGDDGNRESFREKESKNKKSWETRERRAHPDRSRGSSFTQSIGKSYGSGYDGPRNGLRQRQSSLSFRETAFDAKTKGDGRRPRASRDGPPRPVAGDSKVLRYIAGEHTAETPIDGGLRYIPGEHTVVKEDNGRGARKEEREVSRMQERSLRLGRQGADTALVNAPLNLPTEYQPLSSPNRENANSRPVRDEVSASRSSRDPIVVPYTTAASEFIYGAGSVYAALHAGRRKFYKLYINIPPRMEVSTNDYPLKRLAESLHIPTEISRDINKLRLMSKMSNGRPHNGYVLEASPTPKLPIEFLPRCDPNQEGFRVESAPQSREDSNINGTSVLVSVPERKHPYPLVLLLEEVKDSGNFGSIIRTAYYMGVAAIVYNPRASSPVSPIAVKASAGAAEMLPLLNIATSTKEFIERSQKRGWKVYASVAPDSVRERPKRGKSMQTRSTLNLAQVASLLDEAPCILVFGSEGSGISPETLAKVDGHVSIRGTRRPVNLDGLDSLNVSVAAGLLCSAFLGTDSTRRDLKMAKDDLVEDGEDQGGEETDGGEVKDEDRLF
jgi:21S rRNA (GM2251-2'-O)-methyltransferase